MTDHASEHDQWLVEYIDADVNDDGERKEELLEHPGQLNLYDESENSDEDLIVTAIGYLRSDSDELERAGAIERAKSHRILADNLQNYLNRMIRKNDDE